MKRFLFVFVVCLFAYGALRATTNLRQQSQGSPTSEPRPAAPVVVVELFTSEGCSSCPPADALLKQLENTQPIDGAQIIALEEHVDYWNHQGWSDPFSSPEWTLRQQDYSEAFRRDGNYTPQMVVDGREQFVGSRAELAAKAIGSSKEVATASVRLNAAGSGGGNDPHFAISVGTLPTVSHGDTAEVWIGVTESGLASRVSGGENAGRNLQHASVLRSLRRIATADAHADGASFRGDVPVKLKPNWNRSNLAVVVLVQERKSKHILGAASLKLGESGPASASADR